MSLRLAGPADAAAAASISLDCAPVNSLMATSARIVPGKGYGRDMDVLVIGAGVCGLTTGISLAEAGLSVRIRAAAPPEQTTSVAAGRSGGQSGSARRNGSW